MEKFQDLLAKEKYTSKEHLYAQGGSAGGLLMGAVVNMAPGLWHGVIAQVPFVDVVNTMLDASIPLTTNEYDEWGNPEHEEAYTYMKSYSPYENVEKKDYPNMLVTTGLHDSQVQYFEPAKWVAKWYARIRPGIWAAGEARTSFYRFPRLSYQTSRVHAIWSGPALPGYILSLLR